MTHDELWAVCKKLPGDYKPYGETDRDLPDGRFGGDCSIGCRFYAVLRGPCIEAYERIARAGESTEEMLPALAELHKGARPRGPAKQGEFAHSDGSERVEHVSMG